MSLKRSKSFDDLKFNVPIFKLPWAKWSSAKFVSHLNLIDYENKRNANQTVPWLHVPLFEVELIQFCLRAVYVLYKPCMLKKIVCCDSQELILPLIHKLLYVSKLFNVSYDPDESSCLYYNIAYSLFDNGYRDPILLLTLWNNLCLHERSKVAVLAGCIGKHRKRKSAKLLHYTLEMAHRVRFNFWGAWHRNCRLLSFNYCPVTSALLNGNLEQLLLLLQYGFLPNSTRISTYDKHFMHNINWIYDWLRKPFSENCPSRRKLITEVLLFLTNAGICKSNTKRGILTECFRVLWNALPWPYVTRDELYNEIRLRFMYPPNCARLSYFPATETQFMVLCEYYPDLFFNDGGYISEPRSLRQLSKCVIRAQLARAWNLPRGIQYLPIPNQIKSYLCLGIY